MNSPLKWHGGKSYLAERIVALMPKHLHYVEPYAGGLSVLLAKDPEGISEVVGDMNMSLTNFWQVLREPHLFAELQKRLMFTAFDQSAYDEACLNVPRYPLIEAWAFFVRCRQSLAGRMKSFAPLSKNRVRRGMNEQAAAWLSAIEGLPEVHARLQRVVIVTDDALNVIRREDSTNTLFYLDPPYVPDTRSSPEVYQHEMTVEQHKALLRTIKLCAGKVMISGYPHELYDTELKNWTRHTFDLPNNAAGGETKQRKTEVLWCNY